MSVISQPAFVPLPAPTAQAGDALYPLSVDQYHAMIRAGILNEDDPVELLDGLLVQKMAKNPPHRIGVKRLRGALERAVPVGWYVDSQEPVTLSNSEPEPDGMVARGKTEDYPGRHPGPDDVTLVGEVADDSLQRDRNWKSRVYAEARIPVYWIINLVDRQVEVYTQPTGPATQPGYASRQDYRPGDMVPLDIDGVEVAQIAVHDLLP